MCFCASLRFWAAFRWMCVEACLCVHLALDDVIILVDLQGISRVAGDGAAVSVVEVAARATAL